MAPTDIDALVPQYPDDNMKLNAWVYEEPTVGVIVRLFPSYEGNWTIYVMGHTVGRKFAYLQVDFEITSCSHLTQSISINPAIDEWIFDFEKNTGWTNFPNNFVSLLVG